MEMLFNPFPWSPKYYEGPRTHRNFPSNKTSAKGKGKSHRSTKGTLDDMDCCLHPL